MDGEHSQVASPTSLPVRRITGNRLVIFAWGRGPAQAHLPGLPYFEGSSRRVQDLCPHGWVGASWIRIHNFGFFFIWYLWTFQSHIHQVYELPSLNELSPPLTMKPLYHVIMSFPYHTITFQLISTHSNKIFPFSFLNIPQSCHSCYVSFLLIALCIHLSYSLLF